MQRSRANGSTLRDKVAGTGSRPSWLTQGSVGRKEDFRDKPPSRLGRPRAHTIAARARGRFAFAMRRDELRDPGRRSRCHVAPRPKTLHEVFVAHDADTECRRGHARFSKEVLDLFQNVSHGAIMGNAFPVSSVEFVPRAMRAIFAKFAMMDKTWQERVKTLMEERGLSMRALSLRMNMDESYVKKALAGSISPKLETILKFRDALNVPLSYLVDGIPNDPRFDDIARKLAMLSDQEADAVEAVINSMLKPRDHKPDQK